MALQPKRFAALAVVALAAGGLAACGGSSSSSTSSASGGTPVSGGTLRIVAASGPDHIDTVPAYYTPDYMLERGYARQLPDLAVWLKDSKAPGAVIAERCHVPVGVTRAVKVAGPPRRTAL